MANITLSPRDVQATEGPPSSIPALPTELWARIVHFCSLFKELGESTATLHSLCLVNHELYGYALPLLYTRPALTNERRQGAFWSTVCRRPALWGHVRSIVLGRRDWHSQAGAPVEKHALIGPSIRAPASEFTNGRLTGLGEALATASNSSTRWAEQFQLMSPFLPIPTGAGPDPCLLEEAAWWEAGSVGGLLAGHCYSTRPVGDWCRGAEEQRRRMQLQKARTAEDVDMGRGPGQPLHVPWNEGRQRHERTAAATNRAVPSTDVSLEQPNGLSEDDVWAAAERIVTQPTVEAANRDPRPESDRSRGASEQQQLENLRSSWILPAAVRTKCPRRVPWRYRLVMGWLDGGLARFFESIAFLTHIELVLYLGTHLDHDLLEHQLRLLLDPSRLPLLCRLDVRIGYDKTSAGNNSRIARAAFSKTIQLAVSSVDDPRCNIVGTDGGELTQSLVDVPMEVRSLWARDVDDPASPTADVGSGLRAAGRPWRNMWLARDARGTNDPIEE